jgi:MoaA/NifB/PqqE/SkfB family radical SAM enzyme
MSITRFIKSLAPLGLKRRLLKRLYTLDVVFMPTLRCNYRCPYCVLRRERYQDAYPLDRQYSWEEWAKALGKLPRSIISISGGEPFLFQGIENLVAALLKKHKVFLVSNLSRPIDRFVEIVKPPLHITVSFHPSHAEITEVAEKIALLREKGFTVGINMVAHPEVIPRIPEFRRHFIDEVGVDFHIDAFLDSPFPHIYKAEELEPIAPFLDVSRAFFTEPPAETQKICEAGKKHIVIFPDGEAYACFAGYYHDSEKFRLGNIAGGTFRLARKRRSCRLSCVEGCDIDNAQVKIVGE